MDINNSILEKAFKNKVAFYCRLSKELEEKPKSEMDKFKRSLIEKFKNKANYKTYPGFYDLRTFKLNDGEFKNLWLMQDLLNYSEFYKETLKCKIPDLYASLKELSADYQQELLSHEEIEEVEEIEK